MKYTITLNGCDDSTDIECDLSAAELEFVRRLCAAFKVASTYQCKPTMTVDECKEGDEDA
jgi:hypothetical protein